MRVLLAALWKEWLLLWRDRTGLLLLFAMPAMLVLIVSLVQNNVLNTLHNSTIRALLINQDSGPYGAHMRDILLTSDVLIVEMAPASAPASLAGAKKLVRSGACQFAVFIPHDFSKTLQTRAEQLATQAFSKSAAPPLDAVSFLHIYYDPLVQGGFKAAVTTALRMVLTGMEMKIKAEYLTRALTDELFRQLGPYADMLNSSAESETPLFSWPAQPLAGITARAALADAQGDVLPTAVQQNVPAWSLFGMFFIIIPMIGGLMHERNSGVLRRVMTMPVSALWLIAAKLIAYVWVGLLQFALILAMGMYVLPLVGVSALSIGNHPGVIWSIACASALAAAAYGIFLGTVVRTYEQGSVFGAISVVVAAALGGVMVPVFAMPALMQRISAGSPLAWGLDAFLTIWVRGGSLADAWPGIGKLLVFAVACLIGAWGLFYRRIGRGS